MYAANAIRLIQQLRTPELVQTWLNDLRYNSRDTMRTLPSVIQKHAAHCLEAAMAAASILEHHGYPPLILDLESADGIDHTLFLFRRAGKFGTIGKSRDVGLGGRRPVFYSIKELVRSYALPYLDDHAEITGYGCLSLNDLPSNRWRDSRRNVWYVEEALRHVRHYKFHLPKAVTSRWRSILDRNKKSSRTEILAYPDRRFWM